LQIDEALIANQVLIVNREQYKSPVAVFGSSAADLMAKM
jgi:hypothetical protein